MSEFLDSLVNLDVSCETLKKEEEFTQLDLSKKNYGIFCSFMYPGKKADYYLNPKNYKSFAKIEDFGRGFRMMDNAFVYRRLLNNYDLVLDTSAKQNILNLPNNCVKRIFSKPDYGLYFFTSKATTKLQEQNIGVEELSAPETAALKSTGL